MLPFVLRYSSRGPFKTEAGIAMLSRGYRAELLEEIALQTTIPSISPVDHRTTGPPLVPLWTQQVVWSIQAKDLETFPLLIVGRLDEKKGNPAVATASPVKINFCNLEKLDRFHEIEENIEKL